MAPIVNFGAGPAKLPEEVLLKVQKELVHYADTQISVMEMSHRSGDYKKINEGCQDLVRKLLDVPNNYKIIFMQGGGNGLFSAVAMNFMPRTGVADYVVTGTWSNKAAKEAAKYGKVNMVIPKTDKYTSIPDVSTWKLDPNASYVYICFNETVEGIEFPFIPDCKGVPLVADMSSNIMTRKLDVSKFGLIYAGAQKNIGPAGVAVVIVREDLIGSAMPITPGIFDFQLNVKENSLYNTPPCFTIYVMMEVLNWVLENGGIDGMEATAKTKSTMLYDIIDGSNGLYLSTIDKNVRSHMNVTFNISGERAEGKLVDIFVKEAEKLGLFHLKGHRSVGGIRASIYNAVSVSDVKSLASFMLAFKEKYSK